MFTKTILEEIMNIQTLDILNLLFSTPYTTQRTLAKLSGLSVGAVNHSIKELSKNGFIDESCVPTQKSKNLIYTTSPKSADLGCVWFLSIQKLLKVYLKFTERL